MYGSSYICRHTRAEHWNDAVFKKFHKKKPKGFQVVNVLRERFQNGELVQIVSSSKSDMYNSYTVTGVVGTRNQYLYISYIMFVLDLDKLYFVYY